MRRTARLLLVAAALVAAVAWLRAADEGLLGYYRFPAIHGDTIVFTAEGDLWTVNVAGGIARRLTTHAGTESHAAISPDGRTIAFSAEYEGPTEVYSMPLAGGLPVRQSFEDGALVAGWTPGGEILYATRAHSTLPSTQLVRVNPATGARALVPLAQAAEGAFDPGGKTLVFTRLAFQGSSTKRYQGGTAQNLWRFVDGQGDAVPLTADHPGTSKSPMWWNGRVYFASDRGGTMNLWSMSPAGGDLRQHTRHQGTDVKTPALSEGRIVYQHGADLRVFEIARGEDSAIPIRLASDFDQTREKWIAKPLEWLTAAHPSPTGDRVVLTARGAVFVAPAEKGRLVEAPRHSGVRYRQARFLPDGRSLLALSDETSELEFWSLPANGVGTPARLTSDGRVFRFEGVPSPDGKWIAHADKDQKLWIFEVGTRRAIEVTASTEDVPTDLSWSPDSQWLAYVDTAPNSYPRIHLYRPADGVGAALTSDRVESYGPTWSPDGKWLYFLSDRELRSMVPSPWGPRQPEPFFTQTTKIYQVALAKGLRSPFAIPDELHPGRDDKEKKDKEKDSAKAGDGKGASEGGAAKDPSPPPVTIDLEGLQSRVYELPVPAGNYSGLSLTGKHVLFLEQDTTFDRKRALRQLEIKDEDPKPKTLVEDVRGYELSLDRSKILVRKGEDFHVIAADASAPAKLDDTKVDLSGWSFAVNPREEWRQIFTEAWRMMRDYFYDRGMHALDWRGILEKYRPLVDRVSERSELNDLIAEMVGELSTLHIFVRFGDTREGPDQVSHGFLGAQFERDEAAGGWRVAHVYRSDPDYPGAAAPLARPEAGVSDGDVITAINGRPTLSAAHPQALLRNQAGKQVLVEVKPPAGPARQVVIRPFNARENADLRYSEWEYTRRLEVERAGKGRVGYVHLRAMGGGDIAQWARDYYPVFNRQGLIIDVRHNNGGNIDSWLLGKLLRKAWFYWQPRVGSPSWNMQYAFRGHMVVLCDQNTASDGEAFSEGFRRLGLGKVIGTRTWGGEVWLSAQRWLVDSGMASAAETGVYGPEGAWLIEGHGVDPDIVVDNLPHATFKGEDAQLAAAIRHLEDLIAKDPRPVPPAPRYPDKRVNGQPGRGPGN
jgi:tricorn protease